MADTLQSVQWMLEWKCKLRPAEAESNIFAAMGATRTARNYGKALSQPDRQFGIFGDVYVASTMTAWLSPTEEPPPRSYLDRLLGRGKPPARRSVQYPETGYLISEKFRELDGTEAVRAMCENCRANADKPHPAGCTGSISHLPWNSQTQECLEATISRLQLKAAIAQEFVVTNPIWFGLWARSPVSPSAAGLLASLVNALRSSAGQEKSTFASFMDDTKVFIRAARIAAGGVAKLHVYMPPPGHTDFGDYTIFAHCPLCKAEADVERWKGHYPTELYGCKVCGTPYSPAAQASTQKDEWLSMPLLRDLLSEERFTAFAREYFVAQGMSSDGAVETVELAEAERVIEQVIAELARERQNAIRRYVEQSLYAGLKLESITDPIDSETRQGFRAEDFEKLLQRCAARGITITAMVHHSQSKEWRRHTFYSYTLWRTTSFDKRATYKKWRSDHCNELFEALFDVPPALVDAFENQQPGSS